jgi:hypothetical protein
MLSPDKNVSIIIEKNRMSCDGVWYPVSCPWVIRYRGAEIQDLYPEIRLFFAGGFFPACCNRSYPPYFDYKVV